MEENPVIRPAQPAAAARDARATRLARALAGLNLTGMTPTDAYAAIGDPDDDRRTRIRDLAATRARVCRPVSEETWGLAAGKLAAFLAELAAAHDTPTR